MSAASAPLVSILCICHDQRPFLDDCLRSLEAQDYPALEVVILENGSEDGAPEVIRQWAGASRHRVKTILQRERHGICRNLNTAFAASSGTFFSLLAADDLIDPTKTRRQVEALQAAAADVGVVYGDARQIAEDGTPVDGLFVPEHRPEGGYPEGDVLAPLLKANWIPAMAALIRREAWEQVGPWDDRLVYEDWDMWLRLAQHWKFLAQPEPVATYRIVRRSITRTFLRTKSADSRRSDALIKGRAAAGPRTPAHERCRLLAGSVEEVLALRESGLLEPAWLQELHEVSREPAFSAAGHLLAEDAAGAERLLRERAAELRQLERWLRDREKLAASTVRWRQEAAAAKKELRKVRAQLDSILRSASWRLVSPLYRLGRRWRRGSPAGGDHAGS